MDTLWQDIRFGLRTLSKNPGFTAVAVLLLALGIGATTAVFSVVNAVLIRPLPYSDPERLVAISSIFEPGKSNREISVIPLSDMEEWRKQSRLLESMGAFDEVRGIPGVTSAGWITFLPPETRAGVFMGLTFESPRTSTAAPVANHLISSVDYFSTMGIPFVDGRDFSRTDSSEGPPVIIINEALARRYFPTENAVGRKIGTAFDGSKPVREIIGIVKDVHDRGVHANAIPTVYIPLPQFALPYGSIAVRAQVPWQNLVPEIRHRLSRLDAGVPLTDFQPVSERLRESLDEPRFYTVMAAACAFMAVLFVSLGLYGIISFSVSRRTAEFGVRMAVGARPDAILGMVALQGLRMALIGVALGIGLSLAFTRVLRSLLFEITPLDPPSLAASAAIVVVVTLLASYIPARRASRVNPIVALRYE